MGWEGGGGICGLNSTLHHHGVGKEIGEENAEKGSCEGEREI